MNPSVRKNLFAGMAGLSLLGAVAGCAPSAAQQSGAPAQEASTPAAAPAASAASSAPAASDAGASVYKDGTYDAEGTYVSPNGNEKVGVELTIESDTVKAVNIITHPSNPNTKKYQGEFAGGISGQIVGKNIDELNVTKVAGSSLTSGGFNKALEEIKAEAR